MAGHDHTCGLASGGRIRCWGSDDYKALSDAPSGTKWKGITGNSHALCALDNEAELYCWGGNNSDGELDVPEGESDFVAMDYGCGQHEDSTVTCWGSKSDQLSPDADTEFLLP